MNDKVIERLNSFYKSNKEACMALKNWINIKNKPLKLIEALESIYNEVGGNLNKMPQAIKQLTTYAKKYGRANAAYGDKVDIDKVDIRKDENGIWKFFGYDPNFILPPSGQHGSKNPNIYRKDGQVNRNYSNTEEKLYDLGKEVRELYPDSTNVLLTQIMKAIREYASLHKINTNRIIKYIKMGRLKYDDDSNKIISEGINKRTIVITEDFANHFKEAMTMTEYKFYNVIKKYLHDLLVDPVNVVVPDILKFHGYNRYKLNSLLRNNKLLYKSEHINDKDENNVPKTATMQIKYLVPKKNFDRKLRNLYIKLFEKNVPVKEKIDNDIVNEDGEGGCACGTTNASSSGQFSQPLFGISRRTMYGDVDEDTTTMSVGDYQYTVPFGGDKETLSRKNGIGGSVSINKD